MSIEQIIEEIKLRLSMKFGTYTEKDQIKVGDVFRLINQIGEEIIESEPK